MMDLFDDIAGAIEEVVLDVADVVADILDI